MFAKERRDAIASMLKKNQAVTTANLMKHFGVSIETVRKDLLAMEQMGLLSRVHGGAVAKTDMKPFLQLPQRNQEYLEQKAALSFKAAEFVQEGDIIGVDSGSTAVFFAEALKARFSRLTVVTWSRDVLESLGGYKDFQLIVCGGQYLEEEHAFYGELTVETLRHLHVQKAFVFPSAISIEYGIGDYQNDLMQVQKQLFCSSDDVYILADSSKFEKKALFRVAEASDAYTYITDAQLPDELAKLYEENHLHIYKGGIKE